MRNPNGPSQAPAVGLPPAGVFASASRALRRLGYKMVEFRRKQRAYQELAAMSDRELEDIGIGRSDIDAIFTRQRERARRGSSNVIAFDRCRYRERTGLKKRCNARGR